MEKKAWIFIFVAVLLALGLWFGNEYFEKEAVEVQEIVDSQQWDGKTPEFGSKKVLELYIIKPQSRTIHKVLQLAQAEKLLAELNKYGIENTPNQQSEIGFMLVTPEARYSLYITDTPETEKGRIIYNLVEEVIPSTVTYVDVYQLLVPKQIERIRFVGTNKDSDGSAESKRSLFMDITDKEAIADAMEVFSNLRVDSMELIEDGEKVTLTGIENIDGYSIIFDLGESYEYKQICVVGSRYGFTADLDFQRAQRIYTNEYGAMKAMLDGVEKIPETIVGEYGSEGNTELEELLSLDIFQGEGRSTEESTSQGAEDTSSLPKQENVLPPLAEDDKIPLPEGLQIMIDA